MKKHLEEAFALLQKFNAKHNPEKRIRVAFGKFLGYLVSQRGIEANLDQISATLEIKSPTTIKEVQILNGHLATLNPSSQINWQVQFFFPSIKKNMASFCWIVEYETAFQDLKAYLELTHSSPNLFPEKHCSSISQYQTPK